MCWRPSASMAMTPRCRSWRGARPTPAGSGRMSAMTARSVARHRQRHLHTYAGIFQADAYGGYNKLYEAGRPGLVLEASCWVHARRRFFVLADLAASARRKEQGKTPAVISPIALQAVRRIDALFDVERQINGQGAGQRRAVRQELSAPLVAELEAWMREERARLSRHNDVAQAM